MNAMKLLRADSGTDMEKHVAAELTKGFDLYGPLVTVHRFQLGQWMVESQAHHEYRLVQAKAFHELERDVLSLQAEGFDFFHITTEWKATMFQWMCRAHVYDLRYVESEFSVKAAPNLYFPEPSLNVVDHVQKLVRMVPYPVEIPSVSHNSMEGN